MYCMDSVSAFSVFWGNKANKQPMATVNFCNAPHRATAIALRAPTPRTRLRTSKSYKAAADPVVTTEWLAQNLDQVSVIDIRGHVDTVLGEPGVEQSTYVADYNAYLEGHIPVSSSAYRKCYCCCYCCQGTVKACLFYFSRQTLSSHMHGNSCNWRN